MMMAEGGPRVWVQALVDAVFTVLMAAILIRVIGVLVRHRALPPVDAAVLRC